jgi:hypothetical protein
MRVSERSSRLIVYSIPGLVCTMSASGELELVKREVLEYFGKTFEELKEWAMSDAAHPADLPGVIAAWTRSLETGERLVRGRNLIRSIRVKMKGFLVRFNREAIFSSAIEASLEEFDT